MEAPISLSLYSTPDCPTILDIQKSREKSKSTLKSKPSMEDGTVTTDSRLIWIPTDDHLLKPRVLNAGHTGIGGHRRWRTTKATVESQFTSGNISADIESFVKTGIQYLCNESGIIIPRPLGHALHAWNRNEMMYFDFCFIMSLRGRPNVCPDPEGQF